MNDNLVTSTTDFREGEERPANGDLWGMTPEEEAALWEDDVYGPESGSDEDWEADQLTGAKTQGNDSFALKYMDEEKTVSREEVVTLAQKGMDYDRVRRRLEETGSALKEYEEIREALGIRGQQLQWMDALAKEQGLSLENILEDAHVQLLSGKTGQSPEECRHEARRQREEWQRQNGLRQKRREDINAFLQAYPQQAREPGRIPRSVWEAVNRGESLLNAYRGYEVEELRREVARQKAQLQKQQGQERTTGSQHSRGNGWMDLFDAIWYNGE